jgi:hypothetical protein
MDGINEYTCDCQGTGFEGVHCQINIDECASAPCVHNSTCQDLINDYACQCHPGYAGKNCQVDVSECAGAKGSDVGGDTSASGAAADGNAPDNDDGADFKTGGSGGGGGGGGEPPCLNDGLCFEKSDMSLYDNATALASLPDDVRPVFEREFDYADAAGFVCSCMPGYEGEATFSKYLSLYREATFVVGADSRVRLAPAPSFTVESQSHRGLVLVYRLGLLSGHRRMRQRPLFARRVR